MLPARTKIFLSKSMIVEGVDDFCLPTTITNSKTHWLKIAIPCLLFLIGGLLKILALDEYSGPLRVNSFKI
jgi:hypothetical protein